MIIACDGIWNSMTSQEAVNYVRDRLRKDEKISEIIKELFDLILAPDTDGLGFLNCYFDILKHFVTLWVISRSFETFRNILCHFQTFCNLKNPLKSDGTGCDNMTCVIVAFKNETFVSYNIRSPKRDEDGNAVLTQTENAIYWKKCLPKNWAIFDSIRI